MKHSVGIGGSNHDFATCLINEDSQIFAIEDERISRVRHALFASNPCELSFPYVLDWAGISAVDIDQVVGNDYLLEPYFKAVREGDTLGPTISRINKGKFPPLVMLSHHLTHAYSTFFTSPYDEAAILVADGTGSLISRGATVLERETMTYSVGRLNTITNIGPEGLRRPVCKVMIPLQGNGANSR
jgi:carbamoyltransferase